jgi:hypothetical protein
VGTAHGTPPVGPDVSDSDPSHYFGAIPAIGLQKRTNGQDADAAPGVYIPVGDLVLWEYTITNTGNITLTFVTVEDDQEGAVACPQGMLAPQESMTCTAEGLAVAGPYANVGTATGMPPVGPTVTAQDPSHYVGVSAVLDLEKSTNGHDADEPPGPLIPVGQAVHWTYVVTNTGTVPLADVRVLDDQGVEVSCPKANLEPGESMVCTASGSAVIGPYRNVGTAQARLPEGTAVSATDASHYYGGSWVYLPLVVR